jgi:hypothetical protein
MAMSTRAQDQQESDTRPCLEAARLRAIALELVTLLIASGLRLGEALSLRWADVDLESGTLEVKGTVLRVRGGTNYYVLTEVGGWPPDPRAANVGRRYASPPSRVAGLSSHAFRESVATLMSEAGLSSRDAADQLGHSRPSMTTDVHSVARTRRRRSCRLGESLRRLTVGAQPAGLGCVGFCKPSLGSPGFVRLRPRRGSPTTAHALAYARCRAQDGAEKPGRF